MTEIIVDEQDRHWLRRTHWLDGSGYVTVYLGKRDGRYRQERLHRLIMQPNLGCVVDHISGNRLDNRRENLRVCRQAINCQNPNNVLRSDNKTGMRGVWFDRGRNKWAAQITTGGRCVSLGRYDCQSDAARARLRAEEQWRQ